MKILSLLFILLSYSVTAQETPPPVPPPPARIVVEEGKPKRSKIVDFPDVEARFKGGQSGLAKYINNNVQYPQRAIEMNHRGKVYLSFVVEKNGKITNIKVEKSSGHRSLDLEALRLIRKMPKWKPGKLGLRKVRTRCRLPIVFTLE